MLRLFIATFIASQLSIAVAGDYLVADLPANQLQAQDSLSSKFSIDLTGTESGIKVEAQRIVVTRGPRGQRTRHYRTMLKEKVIVEALRLEGDKVIFKTLEGSDIDCGTMGESRVLKIPTLFLSGNCDLTEKLITTSAGKRLQVRLLTK